MASSSRISRLRISLNLLLAFLAVVSIAYGNNGQVLPDTVGLRGLWQEEAFGRLIAIDWLEPNEVRIVFTGVSLTQADSVNVMDVAWEKSVKVMSYYYRVGMQYLQNVAHFTVECRAKEADPVTKAPEIFLVKIILHRTRSSGNFISPVENPMFKPPTKRPALVLGETKT